MQPKKAIILAGGLGTRLRPLTLETPKPMIPVNSKPLIEWVLLNLKKHHITEVILSIGHLSEKIQDYFKDGSSLGMRIEYNIEKELLGTGGAIKDIVTKFKINEPFVLVWGDNLMDINFTQMIETFEDSNAELVMALTNREDVENFGVAKLEDNKIIGFVEKPKREDSPSNLINAGAFIVDPSILEVLPDGISSIEKDCFEKIASKGKIYSYEHEGYWYPTDSMEKYNKIKEDIKSGDLTI
jgi:mannose-1-phosphate guanylyltransferase